MSSCSSSTLIYYIPNIKDKCDVGGERCCNNGVYIMMLNMNEFRDDWYKALYILYKYSNSL